MKLNEVHNIDEAMMAGGREAYATEGNTVYDMDKEYGAPAPKHKPVVARGASSRYDPEAVDPMHRDQRRFQADQDRYLKAQRDAIAKMKAEKGVEEGWKDTATLLGAPVVAGALAVGAQHYDDQKPHVEIGGQNAMIVQYGSSRIPDNAMLLKGADGKMYRVWQQSGKGMNKMTLASPAEVKEGADERKQNALWAQITAHEKAAKKSKDLKQQHHLKMADQLRSQLKTSDNEQGVAESSPETSLHLLKGLKTWQVVIMNNYYRGKYSDYSGKYYTVLASSPEEAKKVVLDNADAILQELLASKSLNGKKHLPRSTALPITADRIGKAEDGTVVHQLTTAGFKKLLSPYGPMNVKLDRGAIVDVQGEEQGVAEGHADQQRRIVKQNGKPVGEVGVDRESSPGNGQWYMKCYAHNIDNAGYDSMEEALAELKHCLKQGMAEAGNKPLEKSYFGMGDTRTPRDIKSQMSGASDEFVKSTADKTTGPFHSKVAKMQGKMAKSELRKREQGVAESGNGYRVTWSEGGSDKHTSGLLLKHHAVEHAKMLQKKPGTSNVKIVPYSMPQGNYSDEANPIRDDGNEGQPGKQNYPSMKEAPDYAAMYESKLMEFAGGMGAGSVATVPGVGKGSNVGSLFGGSYSQKNSPFKKTKAKKESIIKR
jgi:hypothetical protein